MPELKNCIICKKLFQYVSGPQICPNCLKKEESDFDSVKEYLRDNSSATIQMIMNATGVSSTKIQKYLKEGRLEVSQDSPISLVCENCGKRIKTGRFCEECSRQIARKMQRAGLDLLKSQELHSDNSKSQNKTQNGEFGLRYLKRD